MNSQSPQVPSHAGNSPWFSSRIRFAVIVQDEGLVRYSDSVYLLMAADFDAAFKRAIEIGRGHETEYLNADNQRVAWKVAEVLSLDMIQTDSLDGAEVYSEPAEGIEPSWTIDRAFNPEVSRPTQTI